MELRWAFQLVWPDYSLEPRDGDYHVALCSKVLEGPKFSRFFFLLFKKKEKGDTRGKNRGTTTRYKNLLYSIYCLLELVGANHSKKYITSNVTLNQCNGRNIDVPAAEDVV